MANREKLHSHQYRTKVNLCFGSFDIGTLKSLATGQHRRRTMVSTTRLFGMVLAMAQRNSRVLRPFRKP